MDGMSSNHTAEVAPADNSAVEADENAQDENDSEAGDEDSEDDDDIQVTIGDIKTTYELVLLLLELGSLCTLINITFYNSACRISTFLWNFVEFRKRLVISVIIVIFWHTVEDRLPN